MRTVLFAFACFLSSLLPAVSAAQPVAVAVDSVRSTLAYTGQSVAHGWTGTSRAVRGRLTLDFDDPARSRIEVAVPVASFDSGNDRRDAGMRRAVEADRYPDVEFASERVEVEAWQRAEGGYAGMWRVHGQLTFHGQTRAAVVPVTVRIESGVFEAQGRFRVSLEAFGVRRPRLMFVPIGEHVALEGTLRAALPSATTARH